MPAFLGLSSVTAITFGFGPYNLGSSPRGGIVWGYSVVGITLTLHVNNFGSNPYVSNAVYIV